MAGSFFMMGVIFFVLWKTHGMALEFIGSDEAWQIIHFVRSTIYGAVWTTSIFISMGFFMASFDADDVQKKKK